MTTPPPVDAAPARRVHRIEVWPVEGEPDAHARQHIDAARRAFGHAVSLRAARVFLIEAALSDTQVEQIARELLADPVNQRPVIGVGDAPEHGQTVETHFKPGVMDPVAQSTRAAIGEMLPALDVAEVEVRTGHRYDILGTDALPEVAKRFAEQYLANPVIQDVSTRPVHPESFPHTQAYTLDLRHVAVRELDDVALEKLSHEGDLALDLTEMRAVRDYYRRLGREATDIELETIAQTWSEHCVHKTLKATVRYFGGQETGDREQGAGDRSTGRQPSATPNQRALHPSPNIDSPDYFRGRPGHTVNDDGSVTIENILKSTIAAATHQLTQGDDAPCRDFCISVFTDNAGVVRFDEEDAVCIKVETHNRPSAIEPYGGAATGIGGCIRDIMGTGLAALPVANTDVFCVAPPEGIADLRSPIADVSRSYDANDAPQQDKSKIDNRQSAIPEGVIPPRQILEQVVAGVRDYGNRMGIPTVNGAVWFHEDYVANPLVYCGCIGIMPLDKCFGDPQPGDRIIALGGATGRDGIHGATFSSLTTQHTSAQRFSHAVQIGNPITQKTVLDVIMQARGGAGDEPLYHAITDCGAGGFSSAVGEMGEKVGARVTLETAPLKYDGLTYTEVWISEAQERMVLAVPPDKADRLRELCDAEDVSFCDLGEFGQTDADGQPELILTYEGTEVGRLSMGFLHDGVPMPVREARRGERHGGTEARRHEGVLQSRADVGSETLRVSVPSGLRALLAHPNIASKHWIIRQYDHEVQAGSVVKPLLGPGQDGPGDAAVVRPKMGSDRAVAIGCGLAPNVSEKATQRGRARDGDSYAAALHGIDEAVRNVVCVGADPDRIAILDNFCWPSCKVPANMASLVRAAEACYDGALAYKTPFVSGKDSLNNQHTTKDGRLIAIPPTLLITAMGIVDDARRCVTMDAKAAGNLLLVVGKTTPAMGGSHYVMISGNTAVDLSIPRVDLQAGPTNARAVAGLIADGLIASAHDCSDGGLLVAAAEMAFAGRVGLDLDLSGVPSDSVLDTTEACFAETPSRYLIEVAPSHADAVLRRLEEAGVAWGEVGRFADHDRLTVRTPRDGRLLDGSLDDLRQAWLGTLDW